MTTVARAIALALLTLTLSAPALAAPTPTPTKKPTVVLPAMPNHALHTEFTVEVNDKGQVVAAKTVKPSHWASFDAQTYGNVLQMWIRHPDGTAEVGLYKVQYDYNSSTKKIHRSVSLVKAGGDWGNKEGAADQMMDLANKEAHGQKLPPLDKIVGSPSPRP